MTQYATLDVGEKLDYTLGWDDQDWLGTDTLATSSWAVVGSSTGLTLSGQTNTATTATVFGEATAAGTWRLRNSVTTAGGRKGVEDLVLTARAATTTGYLSPEEAEARLWSRYRMEAALSAGDVEVASNELDSRGPFIGIRRDTAQLLEFPRSVNPDGTTSSADVPAAVLDWVALYAYRLSSDDPPAITSSGAGSVSVSYAASKPSQSERRMVGLLEPWYRRSGDLVGNRGERYVYEPGWGWDLP